MGAYLVPGWAWAHPGTATTTPTRTTAPGGASGSGVLRTLVPFTVVGGALRKRRVAVNPGQPAGNGGSGRVMTCSRRLSSKWP
jgi:hypothetical protein